MENDGLMTRLASSRQQRCQSVRVLRLLSATPKSHKLENTAASLHFDFGFGYFHKIRTAGKWDPPPLHTL